MIASFIVTLSVNTQTWGERSASSPAVFYSREPAPIFRTTHRSEEMAENTGYQASKSLGTPDFWLRPIYHEDKPRVIQAMGDTSKAQAKVVANRFRSRDGRHAWLRDHFRIVRDAKGRPIELIGTLSATTPIQPQW